MKKKYILATDIGGTTYTSALFDSNLNLIDKISKKRINAINSSLELYETLLSDYNRLCNKENVIGCGISCPGPLDSELGYVYDTPNLNVISNTKFAYEFSDMASFKVFIENDANLFTLGEYKKNLLNNQIVLGVTLGTGLGVGLVCNGMIYRGANGQALEYATSPFKWGKVEDGLNIESIFKLSVDYYKKKKAPKEIFNLALKKDFKALKLWEVYGERLGLVLSHLVNITDPHKVIIGGGISYAFNYFSNSMKKKLFEHCPSIQINSISISESFYKEESALYGAAYLVSQKIR